MDIREIQTKLKTLGFHQVGAIDGSAGPKFKEAVMDFQVGFAFYDLVRDGKAGPATQDAIQLSLARGGLASDHFRFDEFQSKGNKAIKIKRELIRGLEIYRSVYGPLKIVSGYRDPVHNKKVGGAKNSQHLYGNASDIPAKVRWQEVKKLGVFSGIGYVGKTGLVAHVDVRHLGPNNTTGGTTKSPTTWTY